MFHEDDFIPSIELVDPTWQWWHSYQHHIEQKINSMEISGTEIPDLDNDSDFIVESVNGGRTGYVALTEKELMEQAQKNKYHDYTHLSYIGDTPSKNQPVLFQTFIDLSNTEQSYIDFANKFGLLCRPALLSIKTPPTYEDIFKGESLLFWHRQKWALNTAYELWNLINNKNITVLHNIFKWQERNIFNFKLGQPPDNYKLHSSHNLLIGRLERFISKDQSSLQNNFVLTGQLRIPARVIVTKDDNLLLAKLLLNHIVFFHLNKYPVKLKMFFNYRKDQYEQGLEPDSLLSAMWYQFQQIITGQRIIKQCPICLQWSDVTSVKGSWKHHAECGNRHFVTEHRKRRHEERVLKAILLRREGKTNEEIARLLGVARHQTIERWIKDFQDKKDGE